MCFHFVGTLIELSADEQEPIVSEEEKQKTILNFAFENGRKWKIVMVEKAWLMQGNV